jgi:Fe2+ transport system protein FeoA
MKERMEIDPGDLMNADEAEGQAATVRLSGLPVGGRAIVASVRGPLDIRRRLLEMGFCNRARVTVVRRAPLGDPIEYSIRGYSVSLRKDEARHILVVAEPSLPEPSHPEPPHAAAAPPREPKN